MACQRIGLVLLPLLLTNSATVPAVDARQPDHSQVPGVVIDHSPSATGLYIGSPGIAVLPDGAYVASHDFFGKKKGR